MSSPNQIVRSAAATFSQIVPIVTANPAARAARRAASPTHFVVSRGSQTWKRRTPSRPGRFTTGRRDGAFGFGLCYRARQPSPQDGHAGPVFLWRTR
jgi:hypothetical protein